MLTLSKHFSNTSSSFKSQNAHIVLGFFIVYIYQIKS